MIRVLDIVLDDLHPRGVIDLCVELPREKELVRVDEQCIELIRTVEPTRALENKTVNRSNTRNELGIPSGGSRISPRWGCQISSIKFCQISPNLPEIQSIWTPRGRGVHQKFYYVDPPLIPYPVCE